jgi:hypothetical protein
MRTFHVEINNARLAVKPETLCERVGLYTATEISQQYTYPLSSMYQRLISPGFKLPGHKSLRYPQSGVDFKNAWSHASIRPYIFAMVKGF